MNYKEIKADLFTMDKKYYLVHCISKDLGMGKGIVVEFNKRYDIKNKMIAYKHQNNINIGDAVLLENVFNLITKANYWGKPTYGTLECASCDMKSKIIENDIKYIAMPKIGCGLDRLSWNKVRDMIQELFIDLDVEIIVCYK